MSRGIRVELGLLSSARTSLLLPSFPHRPLCTCSCYCFTRLHIFNQANSISHTSVPKTITKSPRGADGNVYPWQGDQLCWHLERTGLELRLKSMNGARVRPRPPLCIIAFKVSEPYHEQRAHLLMQQHRKAKMRPRGSLLASHAVSEKLEDRSECAVYICCSSLVCQFRFVAVQDSAAHVLSLGVSG